MNNFLSGPRASLLGFALGCLALGVTSVAVSWLSSDAISDGPKRRWFQFTTRRIIAATFWAAVCMGAWVPLTQQDFPNDLTAFSVAAAFGLSPFIGAGTLMGHPIRGLLVGIVAIFIIVVAANTIPGAIRH